LREAGAERLSTHNSHLVAKPLQVLEVVVVEAHYANIEAIMAAKGEAFQLRH
jgi:hypothetical protein